MSRENRDIRRQDQQFFHNAYDQLVVIASWQVGPPDAAGEKRISREQCLVRGIVQADASRSVSGGGYDSELGLAETQCLILGEGQCAERSIDTLQAETPAVIVLEQVIILRAHIDRNTIFFGTFFHAVDMVRMPVGEHYHLGSQAFLRDFGIQGFRLSGSVETRVNDGALTGFVTGDIAVYLEGIEVECQYFEHSDCRFEQHISAKLRKTTLFSLGKYRIFALQHVHKKTMHIGIAGNIGCGKTTLTRMLSEHYGWTPKYEAVTYNPYLEDYYKDIKRWSFNLEVYFLTQRFKDVLEIAHSDEVIIQDRTIFEGVYIFVANNKAMGNLTDRDYETYMDLFRLMMSLVKAPDLLIYLKSSVPHLVAQIQKRGREYEKSIELEYLEGLNERYEKWIAEYPGRVLTIDADGLDFQNRPEDFASITDKIDSELYGLF